MDGVRSGGGGLICSFKVLVRPAPPRPRPGLRPLLLPSFVPDGRRVAVPFGNSPVVGTTRRANPPRPGDAFGLLPMPPLPGGDILTAPFPSTDRRPRPGDVAGDALLLPPRPPFTVARRVRGLGLAVVLGMRPPTVGFDVRRGDAGFGAVVVNGTKVRAVAATGFAGTVAAAA